MNRAARLGDAIAPRAERAIREKTFPGCVVGVVSKSGGREVLPFGNLTYDAGSQRVRGDTIYDVASVTKSIPTASLALALIAEHKLRLSDEVKRYLPELRRDRGVSIEDLLRYRVFGPRLSTLKDLPPEKITEYVFERGFDAPPGESRYTNLPAFLLGLIIERVAEDSLDRLAHARLFDPLGMRDTAFFPNVGIYERRRASDAREMRSRASLPRSSKTGNAPRSAPVYEIPHIAPTEIDDDGKEIRGIAHDESARVFSRARRSVGHAGLFSTAPDMLDFLEALLQGKFPAIVEGAQRGLGWQRAQPWFMGTKTSSSAFGKTGFTGASVVCDGEREAGIVILSNRTYPKRPADAVSPASAINRFRVDICDIAFGNP